MSVATKLVAVMNEVVSIAKDGYNKSQNYEYLSEETVTTELHKAFAKVKLAIVPVDWEIIDSREDKTSSGGIMHNIQLIATYRLIDPEDKDVLEIKALGEGRDTGDKTLNKCMTAAYKYALRQACMISTGDDPDHTNSETTTASKSTQSSKKQLEVQYVCNDCAGLIEGYKTKTGKEYTAKQLVDFSMRDYGKPLCKACGYKAKEAKENSEQAE